MRSRRGGCGILALVLLVCVTVAGCSSGKGGTPQDAKTWTQANAEYLTEIRTLTLPPAEAFPSQIPRARQTNGSPNVFQDGVGRNAADSLWYCGWEHAWLTDLAAASAKAKSDLATMEGLARLSKYTQSTLPGDRHLYTDAWTRAGLGDPSLVQQDFTANCNISLLTPR